MCHHREGEVQGQSIMWLWMTLDVAFPLGPLTVASPYTPFHPFSHFLQNIKVVTCLEDQTKWVYRTASEGMLQTESISSSLKRHCGATVLVGNQGLWGGKSHPSSYFSPTIYSALSLLDSIWHHLFGDMAVRKYMICCEISQPQNRWTARFPVFKIGMSFTASYYSLTLFRARRIIYVAKV